MQQTFKKVYHIASRKDLEKIMVEGLRPLAKNRPIELQVTDKVFDAVARELGIPQYRRGMFAWPTLEIATKGGQAEDILILEIDIELHKHNALVVHQAWLDLAWGLAELAVNEAKKEYPKGKEKDFVERITTMTEGELLGLLRKIIIPNHQCRADMILKQLAGFYWRNAIKLEEYNEETAKMLNATVKEWQHRLGLLPWLPHEVALGTETIEPRRIRIVDEEPRRLA